MANAKPQPVRLVVGNPNVGSLDLAFPEQETQLMSLLSTELSNMFPIRVKTAKIDWKLPKEERKRLAAASKTQGGRAHLLEHFAVGTKKCLRELRRSNLVLVIMDNKLADCEALRMALELSAGSSCPIMTCSDLDAATNTAFGFSASMLAVKKSVFNVSGLEGVQGLVTKVQEIWKLRQRARPLDDNKNEEARDNEAKDIPSPNKRRISESVRATPLKELHLKKLKDGGRAFHPVGSQVKESSGKANEDFGKDFIGFSSAEVAPTFEKCTSGGKRKAPDVYKTTKVLTTTAKRKK